MKYFAIAFHNYRALKWTATTTKEQQQRHRRPKCKASHSLPQARRPSSTSSRAFATGGIKDKTKYLDIIKQMTERDYPKGYKPGEGIYHTEGELKSSMGDPAKIAITAALQEGRLDDASITTGIIVSMIDKMIEHQELNERREQSEDDE